MNFTTDPRKLASAVSWAARRVPSKPDIPILGGMLIELEDASDAEVSFTGFDHEVSTTATLDPTEWDTAGRCVVSGRLLTELVKSLPPKPVTVAIDEDDDTYLNLTCGSVRATLPLMEAADYPSLPVAPEPIGIVHAEDFARQVSRVLPACDITGQIANLAALTGVHFAFGDTELTVSATNRYQLATTTVGWRLNAKAAEQVDFPALIPGEVAASVLKVCDYDGPLTIALSDTTVSFGTGQRTIVASLLDVKGFPNFTSRIPARGESPTVVDVDEVTGALKRAAMVLDGNEPVHLAFDNGHVTMTADSGRGQVTAEIDCDHPADPIEITVNPQYFAGAIGHVGETAELTITAPTHPILVTSPKDEAYRHVMMPIRKPS
jgi:DNA polymerase-3 subunit beta